MSAIDQLIGDGLISTDVVLGPLTTYKAGGGARYYVEVVTQKQLDQVISAGLASELDVLIIGRGSNIVVADSGFDGLVLKLGAGFSSIELGEGSVAVGAATPLPRLARHVVDHGQTGLEFFVGVPGSVGGAVRQNAGCFGSETVEWLIDSTVTDLVTGEVTTRTAADLELGYRQSNLKPSELVTMARFRTELGEVEAARDKMREVTRWRKANQPGGTFNAGSVFKNPPGHTAGEIIDGLGLKGTAVGDVKVSEKHANFFVAGPEATAADIAELVEMVKATVLAATGTILETEIQFVGFEP